MTDRALNYKKTKYSCYFTYLAMSSVFSLPPILFVTFREMYGISYTLLGTLVLVNFVTQLAVDLLFSFFSRLFNIHKTIRVMPLLTSLGFLVYALIPTFFPQYAYAGLLTGTFLFAIAAGLCEVLLSPLVAALPSDNPQRDMSLLHSLFAWGVLTVVVISTAFLSLFGRENWMYLTLFWAMLPIVSCVLFCTSPFPRMDLSGGSASEKSERPQRLGLALCVLCIFLGSAAENTMTNWVSTYMENALNISKLWGDIVGLAVFAILLGLGRTLYAKYGKNISNVLLCSMLGAVCCYLVAGFSSHPVVATVACVMTGLCTSMLWPGSLILMEERFPHIGVAAYALMAAGGDFGGSVAPQLLGIVVDSVSLTDWAGMLGDKLSLSAEQIGMKVGMIGAAIFPLLGVGVVLLIKRYWKKTEKLSADKTGQTE